MSQFAVIVNGVAVPQVVKAEADKALLRHLTHKAVVAADVLRHAVNNMEQRLYFAVGKINPAI